MITKISSASPKAGLINSVPTPCNVLKIHNTATMLTTNFEESQEVLDIELLKEDEA